MRFAYAATGAMVLALATGTFVSAQFDADRVIPGGGIHVQGWMGKVDTSSVRQGRSVNDARFAQEDLTRMSRRGRTRLESGKHGQRRLHGEGDVP
jgi:hypothetical protein